MPRPRLPPGGQRSARVARRVGTRVGAKFALHQVLIHLVPAGCPLAAPILLIELALVGLWVYLLSSVGVVLAVTMLAVTSVLIHPWPLALALTFVVVAGYVGLVVYAHVRLVKGWFRRITR